MQAIKITDGRTSLWQWDTGVSIKVYGCTDVDQMHFVTPGGIISRELIGGECGVPDTALQTDGLLKMYAFDRTENGGVTRCDFLLAVKARPKPADYIDPPDEYDNLEELAKRVAPLIPGGGGSVTPEQIGAAVEEYLAENPVQVEETDPTVPGWAKAEQKPTYTADEVGALPADAEIVDKTARAGVATLSEEIVEATGKINAIVTEKPSSELVPIEFEELISYLISSTTGALFPMASYDPAYRVSSMIEVHPGETVVITARSSYGHALYAFYDANEGFLLSYKEGSGSANVDLVDVPVIVPENAKFLRIAYTAGLPGSVKRYAPSNEFEIKKWHGKKWCVIGDSLTERNMRTTKNYHDYISEATGIAVVNLGASGTGYAKGADDNRAFLNKVANVPVDSDVVTIFGSGNDMSAGLELGTPTDTGTETLCGCINTTIDNLIAIMPAVSLGIVSPTPWTGSPPSNTDSGMAKYCAAMKTICENRSIPFLDLYHCSNLRPWTEEGRAACYTKDDGNGVHPDETGHALIAPRFKAFLETLIL